VVGTLVTLDSVVVAFDLGATPEEIVQKYPSIDLVSVYAVIAYVLRNRESVDVYLTERARCAAEVQAEVEARFPPDDVPSSHQAEVEARFPPDGLRARLLPRRATGL